MRKGFHRRKPGDAYPIPARRPSYYSKTKKKWVLGKKPGPKPK